MKTESTRTRYKKLTTTYPFSVLHALEQLAWKKTKETSNLVVVADLVREAVVQYLHTHEIDIEVEADPESYPDSYRGGFRSGFRGERKPRKEFPPEKLEFSTNDAAAYLGMHPQSFRRFIYEDALIKYHRKNPKARRSMLLFDRGDLDRFIEMLDGSWRK